MSAFLDLIAWSEGTDPNPLSTDHGYDIIVDGLDSPGRMSSYNHHPFTDGLKPVTVRVGPPPLYSTAAGRYQILMPTWKYLAQKYDLMSFEPQNQDAAAVHLLEEWHCAKNIYSGNIAGAIQTCSNIWASFPGNLYHQGGHSLDVLIAKYHSFPA